nr:uncharacterized protein LOC123775271 [Procambarus clarkii]
MSAHAATSRLANSFSVQTHATSRSPCVETGNVGDNSAYGAKRDGSVVAARDPLAPGPCNGGRPSAPPCTTTTANSAKSVSPSSGASASDQTSGRNGQASGSSGQGSSAYNDNNTLTSGVTAKDASSDGVGSVGVGSGRGHCGVAAASPATVRRSDGGRQSRMDTTTFRLRLRKGGGEGVTKKGPLVS